MTVSLWLSIGLVVLGLLWMAWRLQKRLQGLVLSALAAPAQRGTPPGMAAAGLLVLQAAIWPGVIVLVAWSRRLFVPEGTPYEDLWPCWAWWVWWAGVRVR